MELCQILDDNTMEFEVMFGVIHLLELVLFINKAVKNKKNIYVEYD